jgi:hypothetical protein
MTSEHVGRAFGVWGANAHAWSGEERPRVAGFPIDVSGRQRVLGFPADPGGAVKHGRFRGHRGSGSEGHRARLVVAVVAILHGQGEDD